MSSFIIKKVPTRVPKIWMPAAQRMAMVRNQTMQRFLGSMVMLGMSLPEFSHVPAALFDTCCVDIRVPDFIHERLVGLDRKNDCVLGFIFQGMTIEVMSPSYQHLFKGELNWKAF